MPAYKDDKKGTWFVKFRYTDWTGKARFTTKRGFRTKRDALAYEHDIKDGAASSPDMTMRALCKRYMETMRAQLKPSTVEDRIGDIENYILPMLGDMAIQSITQQTIMDWQSWLLQQHPRERAKVGRCRESTRTLAESTANQKNAILNIILNYAVKTGLLARSPAMGVKRVGQRVKRLAFWEKPEYDRFVQAGVSDAEYETYHLCFDVLFYSGLRLAEFRGLGLDELDFERSVLHIRYTMNERGQKIPPKNRQSVRDVPMPASLMARIKAFTDRLVEVPAYGLFPYSGRLLRKHMAAWAEKAGLPYITLHGLRHSHVSYLIHLGVPITVISRRIGHKSPKVTLDTYSHMYEQGGQDVAALLEENAFVGQTLVKQA